MLDHLARYGGDQQLSVVQGGDHFLEAAERLGQGEREFGEKVQARDALKSGVRLLLEHDDYIARLDVRRPVALAAERDLLAVGHSLVDVHLQNLVLRHVALTVALFAAVLRADALALAVAVGTVLLALLHEARAQSLDLHHQTVTLTGGALLRRIAGLRTATVTLITALLLIHRQLLREAVIELLQGDAKLVVDVFASSRA